MNKCQSAPGSKQYAISSSRWAVRNLQLLFVMRLVLFTFHFSLLSLNASSQKISATLDREKIVIGEQVTLTLKLQDLDKKIYALSNWFNLPDTGNHIQVISRESVDTVEVNGLFSYLQKIILTSFDSGNWKLPALNILLTDTSTAKQKILKANEPTLSVLPVDVSGLKDYHEIKDILEVETEPNYWWAIALAISVIVVALLLWLIFRPKKRNIKQKKEPVLIGTALERALKKIDELKKENSAGNIHVKLFYQLLDKICRQYFDEQFRMNTLRSTGDEMMIALRVYLSDEPVRTEFFQLMRLYNAVKFAKYIPEPQQQTLSLSTAEKTLQYAARLSYLVKQPNA